MCVCVCVCTAIVMFSVCQLLDIMQWSHSHVRLWFWQQPPPDSNTAEGIIVYGSCIFLGAGGSTLLVTSLSMVADLIGCTTVRSVYVCLGRGKGLEETCINQDLPTLLTSREAVRLCTV